MSSGDIKSKKADPFLRMLLQTYSEQKKVFQQGQPCIPISHLFQSKKHERVQQKTRSKSRKNKISCQKIQKRVLLRKKQNSHENLKFMELDKQPLWHSNKRSKQAAKQRINRTPQIKMVQYTPKIKTLDPLYEFYSTHDPIKELPSQKLSLDSDKNIITCSPRKQNQSQIQENDWNPTKKQNSMLAVQTLIDQYLMFKQGMRNNNLVKMSELINYVREIKGYYFNLSVMDNILALNPKLYQMFLVQDQKYVKCGKLNPELCKKRLITTKNSMKRLNNRQNSQ